LEDANTSDVLPIPIDDMMDTTETNANRDVHRRSSLPITTTTTTDTLSPQNSLVDRTRQQDMVFYHHQRRNSRSVRSLASGSSTEVEAEADNSNEQNTRDLMEID
jgi:hypothetical protein